MVNFTYITQDTYAAIGTIKGFATERESTIKTLVYLIKWMSQ